MESSLIIAEHLCPCFGVVPVIVNTGAALLPALLAGAASFVALLFKPRELLRLCRAKPHIPLLVIATAIVLYILASWLLRPAAAGQSAPGTRGRKQTTGQEARTDWAKVALELIRQEERDLQRAYVEERQRRSDLEKRVRHLEALLQNKGELTAPEDAANRTDQDANTQPPQAVIFRGSGARCGDAGGGSPLKLKPLWEFNEEFTMYLSSPLAVDGAVYSASCLLDPPDNYGAIFCLDAATGEERWYTDVLEDPQTGAESEFKAFFSSPAVSADGKYLVIGQGLHVDTHCRLICLETQTGNVHWTVTTPLHIEGSPAIDGDLVVAGAGAVEGEDLRPKGDPGYVFAVRLSDGKQLWRYAVNDPESSPVIEKGIAYIGSGLNGNAVVALRTQSDAELKQQELDRLLWKTDTPYPATGAVTLTDEVVLIGCGNANYVYMSPDPKGAVLALDRETGKLRWKTEMSNSVLAPIAARDGKAVCSVLSGEVVALNLQDAGKVLWRRQLHESALLKTGPAFTGKYAYVVTHDGYLVVLDASDGKIVERNYLNAKGKPGEMGLCTSSPFVSDGQLYVGTETGGLRCFVGTESGE